MPTKPDGTKPDRLFDGALLLHQAKGGHRFGMDGVLLAAFAGLSHGRVADFGAGSGGVGLRLAQLSGPIQVDLCEIDPLSCALIEKNIAANSLEERVRLLPVDLTGTAQACRAAGLPANAYNLVVTNPPFLEPERHRASPDARRHGAHHLARSGTERWFARACDVLKPGGRLALIHRADALPMLLEILNGRFGAIAVTPVHTRPGAQASRVLIDAIKGSRAPFMIRQSLIMDGQTQ
jgi:tRNA1(Val) A37 N6-methylase TrmN6